MSRCSNGTNSNYATYPRVSPFTASPAPLTSLSSSSSPNLRLPSGRRIGLAIIRVGLKVGLDVIFNPLGNGGYWFPIVGEFVAELAALEGIVMGIAIGSLELAPLVMGEPVLDEWESLR